MKSDQNPLFDLVLLPEGPPQCLSICILSTRMIRHAFQTIRGLFSEAEVFYSPVTRVSSMVPCTARIGMNSFVIQSEWLNQF